VVTLLKRLLPAAMQNVVVGHDTPASAPRPVGSCTQVGVAAPGLVEPTTWASVLAARQSAVDGQEMSTKLPGRASSSHTGATAVGFMVRARWLASSSPTQSVSAGQATALKAFVPSISVSALQDVDEPPGVVERVAPP